MALAFELRGDSPLLDDTAACPWPQTEEMTSSFERRGHGELACMLLGFFVGGMLCVSV